MLRVVGIDPGGDVGVALIPEQGDAEVRLVQKINKEVDIPGLVALLKEWQPTIVYLEKVHSMPGQGVAAVFSFGQSFGAIKGVLVALGIPYVLITPQAWKKVALAGMPKGGTVPKGTDAKAASKIKANAKKVQKQAALAFAKARYPSMNFRLSARARTDNIDMGDAACIAHVGFVTERGAAQTQQTVARQGVQPVGKAGKFTVYRDVSPSFNPDGQAAHQLDVHELGDLLHG